MMKVMFMSKVITAIYGQGLLHPLTPLKLQEHQRVQIQVLPEITLDKTEQVIQFLEQIGVLTLPRKPEQGAPVSEAERQKLARKLGEATSQPLSEIIIEERGER